jgi:hypothetical protein
MKTFDYDKAVSIHGRCAVCGSESFTDDDVIWSEDRVEIIVLRKCDCGNRWATIFKAMDTETEIGQEA